MFGGFAGSFFATRQGFISPESFTFIESAIILAIVVLGGMGSQVGVVIASVVMIGGFELLRNMEGLKLVFGQEFNPSLYRMILFGFAMVAIMVWKPRGLISARLPTVFLKREIRLARPAQKKGGQTMSKSQNQPSPLLHVEHMTMRFGGLIAIDDLSFRAAHTDITAIIGPNGAGKTTLFNCLTGFYKPSEGMISLTHQDGTTISAGTHG